MGHILAHYLLNMDTLIGLMNYTMTADNFARVWRPLPLHKGHRSGPQLIITIHWDSHY